MKTSFWNSLVAASLLAFGLFGAYSENARAEGASGGPESREDLTRKQKREFSRLVKEAKAAFETGAYEEALPKFERAYDIYAAAGLLYRMGQSHERLGESGDAIADYERFLDQRPDTSKRSSIEERIAKLRDEREVVVRIASKPSEARVSVAEGSETFESRGRTPLEVEVSPGETRFKIQKKGYRTRTETVELKPGTRGDFDWELAEKPGDMSGADVSSKPGAADRSFPWLPAVAGGVGLAAYGTLLGIGSHCRSKATPCDPGLYRPVAVGSYAGAGLAALGFGTTGVLLLTRGGSDRNKDGKRTARVRLRLTATGLRLTGSF